MSIQDDRFFCRNSKIPHGGLQLDPKFSRRRLFGLRSDGWIVLLIVLCAIVAVIVVERPL